MNRFDEAVRRVLDHEGGFVDDPDDPGGATNWGVSLRFLRARLSGTNVAGIDLDADGDGDVDADDVRGLTREQAVELYRTEFWDRYDYEKMPVGVGEKVFDACVNMGPRTAHRLLQRAIRAAGGGDLDDDGIVGPKTESALWAVGAPACVVASFRSEMAGFYRVLATRRPSMEKFLRGWLRRAYD